MIELTVKTMDSQNHQFSVEDDITVEQFKARIAETVNIPAETQRIIYCGRVLQDSSKLSDYDVNGKVVHLVHRPPPGMNPRQSSRSSSPQPQRRGFRGFRTMEQGNAMYLGSVAFPGNLMESQGIVPPPPTHSLSGSRLNVARRMLRRAEAVLQLLENPSARSLEPSTAEENQEEEEVTPVIEARVIIPNNTDPIDEVLSVVQNSVITAATNTVPPNTANTDGGSSAPPSITESAQRSPNQSETSTPGGVTPRSSSTENLNAEPRPDSGLPENASRTSEMASLLTMLGQLQTRFAPFLQQYQNFMVEDPEMSNENLQRQTQTILNRVSEVMHYLGHAYHSLSDIIIRVRTPPPRPLLCRPILIQHSAVVQTGIPVQVETQINLSADRPPAANANQTINATTTEANTTTTTTTASSTPNLNAPGGTPMISVQPGFVGLPFMPGAHMRVQSFPVEIRAMRSATATPRQQNINSNSGNTEPVVGTTPTSGANNATANSANGGNLANAQGAAINFGNPNVELFMEVTPEGITIDSLETTLVGSNQANNLLRGALNGPPPEFLQSLMQMAGQIISRNIPTTFTPSSGSAPIAISIASTESTQQSGASQGSQSPSGQNSQARGNTQTYSTTATHTLPTPRPHVHLAQQAMQGGFDPFLPCNSHHISRRRRHLQMAAVPTSTNPPQANAPRQESGERPGIHDFLSSLNEARATQNQDTFNVLNEILERHRSTSDSAQRTSNVSNDSNTAGISPGLGAFASLFSSLHPGGNMPDLIRQGPSLDQILQHLQPDEQYVPGESIITDLIMLFIRNFTLVDLFTLNSGNLEPINRNVTEIQNFFRTRICNGDVTPTGVDRGVGRLITEMQPFLESFRSLAVRGDIDMVRSAEQLFRQRLPNIISVGINLNPNNVRLLLEQCITTGKQLLALILLASSDGQPGVERTVEQVMNNFMHDIPQDVQNWTLRISREQLRHLLANLSIPESILQPYIVRQSEVAMPSADENRQNEVGDSTLTAPCNPPRSADEAMDFDVVEETAGGELKSQTIVKEDTEPLPSVVLGSEPWHGQVPEDWVPIITRDSQKQRRQSSQRPFSDSYLSGMPSKRRKIVNNSKPQGSLPQVITDSMRQAITATGLTPVAPLETVSQAAGASLEIQTAYRNMFRTTVQASLRDNEDFLPERFPNTSNYFNIGQQ
ncbi:large proline-rich protein bag6-A isoform X3 [Leptinotarsa decemlineata]|uniref:large proline-rich protein bag6-A isoform X3 n=1 Tax=Leptinotarsa decemlineata TaxID=7539 RepID=UPI003D3086C5